MKKPSEIFDPTEPLITGTIYGKDYLMYLDSGSSFCALTSGLVSALIENGAKLHKQNFKINMAQGQTKSQGYFILDVSVQDRTVRQKFLVMDDLIRPIIIGRDFMCRAQLSLHFNPNGWSFHTDDMIVYAFETPTRSYLNLCAFGIEMQDSEPALENLLEGFL
mgnify:CR=1 FL=1